MSASVGSTVNIWQYALSIFYLLLMVDVCKCWCHCYCLAISISFSLSPSKGPCLPHSCKSIAIRQRVSLRKYGWSHTGQSPSCNKTSWGQTVALIEVLAVRQQVNQRTLGCNHAGPLPLDNMSTLGYLVLITIVLIF